MRSLIKHAVPYHSQWMSADLVPEFIAGARSAEDDPLWPKSGADTPDEYAFWAPRMCGVACLRMALEYWERPVSPPVPLVRDLVDAGAYVREGDRVKGLIYQPFADYVTGRWGLRVQAEPELPAARVRDFLTGGGLAMLSVHKTIRTLDPVPPSKGGHLVLAVGCDAETLLIHNPSGLPGTSQEFAPVRWNALGRFYAGRGVTLEEA